VLLERSKNDLLGSHSMTFWEVTVGHMAPYCGVGTRIVCRLHNIYCLTDSDYFLARILGTTPT